jgi:hypothetical protein
MPNIQEVMSKPKFQKISHRPWTAETFEKNTNRELINSDDSQDLEEKLLDLGNSQKYIMECLIKNINTTKKEEDFVLTNRISSLDIHKYTRIPINTIVRSIFLLKKANIIATFKKKPGKGGYAIYRISKEIYLIQKNIFQM